MESALVSEKWFLDKTYEPDGLFGRPRLIGKPIPGRMTDSATRISMDQGELQRIIVLIMLCAVAAIRVPARPVRVPPLLP